MSIKDSIGRLSRWSLLLQQYDFELQHRAGHVNTNADALSRCEYGICTLNALHMPLGEGGLQLAKLFQLQRCDSDFNRHN